MPVFVIAYVLIFTFSVRARLAAGAGLPPASARASWPCLRHLILPSVALGIVYMALIARITRASMLDVLAQDYIRTAHAKGLAPEHGADRATR